MPEVDTHRLTPPPYVRVGVVRFSKVDEAGAIGHVLEALEAGRGGWVCPVNVDVLRQCTRMDDLCVMVNNADLVLADGAPIVLASRLAGEPLAHRVAGSTLLFTLSKAAAHRERSVFLLGGAPGTAAGTAERLRAENPGLTVAGVACPPLGFERDPEETDSISDALVRSSPDIVFVGLGFPKQDRLIGGLRSVLPDAWFVSCGTSFSFASGSILRAPIWMQNAGLEWVHRLVQDPRRLFRRYVVDGIPFAVRLLAVAAIGSAVGRR